jgi:hypothetical protein
LQQLILIVTDFPFAAVPRGTALIVDNVALISDTALGLNPLAALFIVVP